MNHIFYSCEAFSFRNDLDGKEIKLLGMETFDILSCSYRKKFGIFKGFVEVLLPTCTFYIKESDFNEINERLPYKYKDF